MTDVKIIETAPSPAQAYFSFKISDADGDVDLATGSPIKAGVFCPMAGFAADSWGKAETQDKQLGVAHYRASYAPHRGVGECSFDLSVKNKAGNKSALVKAKINFK